MSKKPNNCDHCEHETKGSQLCRWVHSAPIKAEDTDFICPDVKGVNNSKIVAAMLV